MCVLAAQLAAKKSILTFTFINNGMKWYFLIYELKIHTAVKNQGAESNFTLCFVCSYLQIGSRRKRMMQTLPMQVSSKFC